MDYSYWVTPEIKVTPVEAGWVVELWWASPLTPDNWLIVKYGGYETDENGEISTTFTYTTQEEFGTIWLKAVAPAQPHPVTGEPYSRFETPAKEIHGYTSPYFDIELVPQGTTVLIAVQGRATSGFPPPDLKLEILVDSVVEATQTFPSVDLDVYKEVNTVYDVAGTHVAQGRMTITNDFGTVVLSTDPVQFDI